ncbi:MAG: cupin domain-containing protein [Beijerinckiaceae bacterium]|nr:cupin domain-containing protein [Beijerinckiaceae bacterium]
MDDAKVIERRPAAAVDNAVVFSMRNLPLLEQGTTYDPLATAENLWLSMKVYASGGENALHSHGGEDHAFIVMQGKATFTFGDGRTQVVGIHEGVMIPKNVLYKFEADEAENLVLMRVGGGERTVKGLDNLTHFGTPKDVVQQTTFGDGSTKVGTDPKNGETSKKRVYAKGKYFAPT